MPPIQGVCKQSTDAGGSGAVGTVKELVSGLTRRRRLLLVSDIPPSLNYSGGLYIMDLIRCSRGRIRDVFAVLNPSLSPQIPEDLAAALDIRTTPKPEESHSGEREDAVRAAEARSEADIRDRILPSVIEFARAKSCRDFLVVLEGQTMIRLAAALAAQKEFRINVLVMDPPGSWLAAHLVDSESTAKVLAQYDRTLANAAKCCATSEAMASRYAAKYRTRCSALLPSIPER